jgi:hypothetical protein
MSRIDQDLRRGCAEFDRAWLELRRNAERQSEGACQRRGLGDDGACKEPAPTSPKGIQGVCDLQVRLRFGPLGDSTRRLAENFHLGVFSNPPDELEPDYGELQK